jgi:hypothetical protein
MENVAQKITFKLDFYHLLSNFIKFYQVLSSFIMSRQVARGQGGGVVSTICATRVRQGDGDDVMIFGLAPPAFLLPCRILRCISCTAIAYNWIIVI